MSERVLLSNRRRFPRAHLSCGVVYRDRFQSWQSRTRDVSLGGCRVVGYYPFPVGKMLALKMTHPFIGEPAVMNSKIVRLQGGAENALTLAFDEDVRSLSKFEEWIRKVAAKDPSAMPAISQTPDHLPIDARLHRAQRPRIVRSLSPTEIALLQRLDLSSRPVPLIDLRREWGDEWERRAWVMFNLIADGIVLCSMRPHGTMSSTAVEEPGVGSIFQNSTQLIEGLQREYGPLGKNFTRALETITQEMTGTEPPARFAGPKEGVSRAPPVLKKRE